MGLFFNAGGYTLTSGPKKPTICLTAIFQTTISLKATWPDCDD